MKSAIKTIGIGVAIGAILMIGAYYVKVWMASRPTSAAAAPTAPSPTIN